MPLSNKKTKLKNQPNHLHMLNNLTTVQSSQEKDSKFTYYSILIIFSLSLIGSIQNIEKEAIFSLTPIILIAILITNSFIILLAKGIDIKSIKDPLFIAINIFGAIILISTIYSKYQLLTASRALQFILASNSLYIITSHIKNQKIIFESIAKINITFSLIASIYGVTIYLLGNPITINDITVTELKIFSFNLTQRMYDQRISSFLGNPNPFGVHLMVSIISCFYFLKEYKSKWHALLIIFFIYTLALTGSRASAIGLLAGSLIFIVYSYVKNNLAAIALRFFLLGFFIIIFGYILSNPEIIKYIFSLMGRESNNLSGREIAWIALINQIIETPYLGIGYRISTEAILEENLIGISNSHNLYLSILSEVGLIGFLFFLYIYTSPILFFIINKVDSKDSLKNILICILISLLINQFFEDMLSPLNYLSIFTFLILLIHNNMQIERRNKNQSYSPYI